MSNKDKGGRSFGDISQNNADGAVGQIGQNEATVTNSFGAQTDEWQEVDLLVSAEVPEDARPAVQDAVDKLKTVSQDENTDPTVIADLIDKLKPYKPLGRALLAALKVTPIGAVAAPLVAAAYELSK